MNAEDKLQRDLDSLQRHDAEQEELQNSIDVLKAELESF